MLADATIHRAGRRDESAVGGCHTATTSDVVVPTTGFVELSARALMLPAGSRRPLKRYLAPRGMPPSPPQFHMFDTVSVRCTSPIRTASTAIEAVPRIVSTSTTVPTKSTYSSSAPIEHADAAA